MTLRDLVERLSLTVACGEEHLNRRVTGGYAGDLLSDVIANGNAGSVWITMQVHINIVAVAVLKELAAVILVNGRQPAEDTLRKAAAEGVPVLVSSRPAFETIGELSALGIGRDRR